MTSVAGVQEEEAVGLGKRLMERREKACWDPTGQVLNAKLGMLDVILDRSRGFHIFNDESSDAMVIMTTILMLGRLDGMRNAGSEVPWETRRSPGQEGGRWWEGKEKDKQKGIPGWSRGFEDSLD